MSLENTYESYLKFILEGDKKNSRRVIEEAIKSGVPAIDIYYHVFYPTMVKTGELWQKNKISVAREHMITATTQNIIASLYPLIFFTQENCMHRTCWRADNGSRISWLEQPF